MDTLAIENFISVKATDGPKLVAAGLEQHVKDYAVDVMNLQRAAELVPGRTHRDPAGKRRHAEAASR